MTKYETLLRGARKRLREALLTPHILGHEADGPALETALTTLNNLIDGLVPIPATEAIL